MFVPIAISGGVAGGLIGTHHRQHRVAHHHTSTAGVVFSLSVLGLVLLAELLWFWWLARRHRGIFAAPLVMGLQRRDRRRVLKSVRRGRPLGDPTLSAVARSVAERTVKFWRISFTLFAVAAVGEAVAASLPGRPVVLRLILGASALAFIVAFGYQRWAVAGARRYLAVSDRALADPAGAPSSVDRNGSEADPGVSSS